MTNSAENKARIEALKTLTSFDWVGNTVHANPEAAFTAINLQTINSGWYKPQIVRIPGLAGMYMVNEDGNLNVEHRVIKLSPTEYKIEYMTQNAYNKWENKVISLLD